MSLAKSGSDALGLASQAEQACLFSLPYSSDEYEEEEPMGEEHNPPPVV